MPNEASARRNPHLFRYLLIGFFTVAPLWVTWPVFDFLLGLLASTGVPFLRAIAGLLRPLSDTLASCLLNSEVQYALSALFTLVALYLIGFFASFVVGKKLIATLEDRVSRLPLVQTIYGATKRFLQTISKPPVQGQRVVLISFPSADMKRWASSPRSWWMPTRDRIWPWSTCPPRPIRPRATSKSCRWPTW